MTTVVAPPEAIRRYFAGVNGEDWDDFRGIWHEDAAVDVVGGVRLRGVDEIMEYYPRVLGNFPVHFDDPVAVHVAGDVVTVEIDFQGETVEGVPASFRATDVFRLEDGRVGWLPEKEVDLPAGTVLAQRFRRGNAVTVRVRDAGGPGGRPGLTQRLEEDDDRSWMNQPSASATSFGTLADVFRGATKKR